MRITWAIVRVVARLYVRVCGCEPESIYVFQCVALCANVPR